MKLTPFFFGTLLMVTTTSTIGIAEEKKPGQIYNDLSTEENYGFNPQDLSFALPNDGVARAEFRSEDFQAIILKSGQRCSFDESERLRIQDFFPNNKVFMDTFGCDDDVEEVIHYSNVNPDYSFIAVYAGRDLVEAKAFFDQMNIAGKFPGANIRTMQVVLVYP